MRRFLMMFTGLLIGLNLSTSIARASGIIRVGTAVTG